jgi:UDP-glucose 4-epimerase
VRVLVTGGSGFIGSHVVDKLRERGITVRIYDMVYPDFRDDIEYYHASLLDLDSLRMAMSKVDAIFHLAAVADVKDALEEPHYAEAINVRGTINVLEIARKAKGIKRVIFGSTIWVYSNTEADILDEDSPLAAPSHIYTATKMAGEYYCQCYSRLYDLPTTILRFGIPYGPRARESAVIPAFIKRALNGEPLTIAGDGSQYRNFIYVEDLAEGNVLALKEIAKNKIYNLDGKEKISIKQIADTIRKILGKVEIQYVEARPGDFSGKEIRSTRAKEELGWEPKFSFEEGIRKYIDWFKENQKRGDVEWTGLQNTLKSRPS